MGIYVIQSDGTHARKLARFGDYPTWSPDGKKIAYSGFASGIFLLSVNGNGFQLVHRPKKGAFDDGPEWSPDGKRIAFTEANDFGGKNCSHQQAQIYVMKRDGTSVTRVTSANGNLDPTWSPDGTKIAFLSIARNEDERFAVMTMNPDGSGKRKIADIDLPCVPEGLTWSPDGTELAFIARQRPGSDTPWLFTMNSDGTKRQGIVEGDGRLNWQSLPR